MASIEDERSKAGFVFEEAVTPNLKLKMSLNSISAVFQSKFQSIQVINTTEFGQTLVTDGKTQSAAADEAVYHESLVHPAMIKASLSLGRPVERVYIGGGGELATAREVLRYPGVKEVVMVDIDEELVDVCRRELPQWGGDKVFNDPRLQIHYTDAFAFMENYKSDTFDVVIMDISDPIECGPGIVLYTQEFYRMVKNEKLSEGGVLVTQSGSGDIHTHNDCMTAIFNTIRSTFSSGCAYKSSIPSFGGAWGFSMGWDGSDSEEWKVISSELIDQKIQELIEGGASALKYYDGETHRGMFALAKVVRESLRKEERVITKENPVFMY